MTEGLKRRLADLRPELAKASAEIGRELAFSVTTGSEAQKSLRVLQSLLNGMIDAVSLSLRIDDAGTEDEAGGIAGGGADVVFDSCHWCVAAPASECMILQVEEGDAPRMLRVDHLCSACASEYWGAVRKAAKRRSA